MTLWPVMAAKVRGWMNSCGGAGHDDVRVEAGVLEETDEFDGLVGGDASGDGDGDLDAFGHCGSVSINTPAP